MQSLVHRVVVLRAETIGLSCSRAVMYMLAVSVDLKQSMRRIHLLLLLLSKITDTGSTAHKQHIALT